MTYFSPAPKRACPVAIVAIPVRDEAERIGACLHALNEQTTVPDAVVLLLNNCTDGTEAIARAMAPRMRFGLHIACRKLPPHQANAGHARRLAMALAARRAGTDGVLLTTDADTVVPPDWVRRNLTGLLRGADLVCGRVVVDPVEAALIPAHLRHDDALEHRLIDLTEEITWIIDPDPRDPPPRHTEGSGASLAVWVSAYDQVGGIPAIPSGEDRAFVASLRRIDAAIRHDPEIEVVVSGRVVGRAEGGMADAIRRRMVKQDEFTDDAIEPAADTLRRVSLRRRARLVWSGVTTDRHLAADLGVDAATLKRALAGPNFGEAWAAVEALGVLATRRRVRFVDLQREIAAAEALLSRLLMPDTLAAD